MKRFLAFALSLASIIPSESKVQDRNSVVLDEGDSVPNQAIFSVVPASPVVQLGNTTIIGTNNPALNQDFFGGIPFAQAPIGNMRLQPPVLLTSLNSSTFNATTYGPSCIQRSTLFGPTSEDCLRVNILRPAGLPAGTSIPVMAWIYGGAFIMGSSAIYNSSVIVEKSVARGTPIIYVSFNYRLGPLGFPQGQEAENRSALNLGLKDQLTALQWIQDNIGAFGGDKTKVTVFGESAGAISIAIHFLNTELGNLARAAILESGSAASLPLFSASRPDAESAWSDFISAVPECANATTGNTFECVQAATSADISQAVSSATHPITDPFPWVPTLDGSLLPALPSALLEQGNFTQLPFISGTNLDEGTLFTPQDISSGYEISTALFTTSSPSPEGQWKLAKAVYHVMDLYSADPTQGSPFNTGNDTFGLSVQYKRCAAIINDMNFLSQRRTWIQAASNLNVPTFGYLFSDPRATVNPRLFPIPPAPGSLGVAHSSEVPFVYGTLTTDVTAARTLSSQMTDYWVSFATSLDPNDGKGTERPTWAAFTSDNQVIMQLNGDNTTMIPDNFRMTQNSNFQSDPTVWSR